ncbi:MAG: hypothetical protein CSA20_02180 [Deltaproteobacteria bacterium]|nr:MAG: hypothetical protein CSA20_02180 [Deltaproteobacteria bacterium]
MAYQSFFNPAQTTARPASITTSQIQYKLPPFGTVAAAVTVAGAVSIGSNILDVQRGIMTPAQAVVNSLAKGATASLVTTQVPRTSAFQVLLAAGLLATAGYTIDSLMKKSREQLCLAKEQEV